MELPRLISQKSTYAKPNHNHQTAPHDPTASYQCNTDAKLQSDACPYSIQPQECHNPQAHSTTYSLIHSSTPPLIQRQPPTPQHRPKRRILILILPLLNFTIHHSPALNPRYHITHYSPLRFGTNLPGGCGLLSPRSCFHSGEIFGGEREVTGDT
jgi:hypothetical protein